jgi:antitoxin (DNA-binding transcriptional repressor) of toxin-antitoxin stability system
MLRKQEGKISSLIDRVKDGDEIIIIRLGKQVARLVPVQNAKKILPALKDFCALICVYGESLSTMITSQRNDAAHKISVG